MTELMALAEEFDRNDLLAPARQAVVIPEGCIYLDGNSLGPLTIHADSRVNRLLRDEWGKDLIGGWNEHHWLTLPRSVGDQLAPLIGASPGEVLCCDNLSSNLYKLVFAALNGRASDRNVVVVERDNFPTDNYVIEEIQRQLGVDTLSLRLLSPAEMLVADFSDVALVVLSHVNYRTGELADLPGITRAAQAGGARVLWDLAHSAGVVDVALNASNVDFAVGCTYKFLNGGPGSPGFLFISERHLTAMHNPIAGWMGHARLFDFEPGYTPAAGIERFLTGTPSILALSSVAAALEMFEGIAPSQLRAKSVALTDFFLKAVAEQTEARALTCVTPRESDRRGSQICLQHADGYAVAQALIAAGVIVDFRAPDIVRFGFSPLVNSFTDVAKAVVALERVLDGRLYKRPEYHQRKMVT